ncbi:MAG TPA: CoA transferase, partial [Brevundimonas sp.]
EPQAVHRGLVVEQSRADLEGPVKTVASPIRMSKTPVAYDAAPPALGQDTDNVLEAMGLDAARLATLRGKNVI